MKSEDRAPRRATTSSRASLERAGMLSRMEGIGLEISITTLSGLCARLWENGLPPGAKTRLHKACEP